MEHEEFDYCFYFEDGKPDVYRYCVAFEEGHAIYHRFTIEDYEEFGYLIGMDRMNLSNMARICGGDPEGKCSLLLAHAGQSGDVADPWYTGDFEATWQDVNIGCRALLKELTEKK